MTVCCTQRGSFLHDLQEVNNCDVVISYKLMIAVFLYFCNSLIATFAPKIARKLLQNCFCSISQVLCKQHCAQHIMRICVLHVHAIIILTMNYRKAVITNKLANLYTPCKMNFP